MGRMSKAKGARGELEFARFCTDQGYPCHRGRQYHGGSDSPDIKGLPLVHVEVKRTERLRLYEAMAQAVNDAGQDIPIVAHRQNDEEWLVVMRAEDWFRLYREWEAGQVPFKE